MKTFTYTAARENLARIMQQVCEDHDTVVITRRRDEAVVISAPTTDVHVRAALARPE